MKIHILLEIVVGQSVAIRSELPPYMNPRPMVARYCGPRAIIARPLRCQALARYILKIPNQVRPAWLEVFQTAHRY